MRGIKIGLALTVLVAAIAPVTGDHGLSVCRR